MSKVAFIGLGNMGAPMAANLVKAGHAVLGFDLVEAQRTAAAATGVTIAAGAREAVAGADAVVTMLPAGRHVIASWSEFLDAAPKGSLIIDCSTIDVDSAKRVHEAGAAAGVLTLDAPVSRRGRRRDRRHADLHVRRLRRGFRAGEAAPQRRWASASSIAAAPGWDRPPRSATT